jgi:DNA-binding beta-propeller fold protein YncE
MDRNVNRTSARWVARAVGVPVLATVFLAGAANAQPVPFQLPGTTGCVGATSADGCAQGVALLNAHAVTVTPDGRHVYVLSPTDDAVAVFDRNPETRALTQKGGTDACISETGSGGSCGDVAFLDNPESVVLNPDPRFLHVASAVSNAVMTFFLDPATGVILGMFLDSCVSEIGEFLVCQNGRGLVGPSSLATSPDGRHIYVASFDSDAVTQLKWNQGLSQDVDPAACVSETGSGGDCVDGHALDQPFDVAVSPDAKNVYVASWGSHAIAVFDRNLGSGVLTQKAGTAACVSETGTGGLCADGVALQGPRGVTVSPDGKNVYATTDGSDAVVVFDRDAATGAISQKAGANGCISDTAVAGRARTAGASTAPSTWWWAQTG